MIIGVPKEIKNHEYRVGLTPASVGDLVRYGHKVIVENNAGTGINVTNKDYVEAGAVIYDTAGEVFAEAEMIIKVKEPQAEECKMLRSGQILFTYLHLAPDPGKTRLLIESGVIAVAYETVTGPNHSLPLLAPMSEIAGRLSIQAGAHCLEKPQNGAGILLGGVSGVLPAKVLVIGGGIVGDNAASVACGMGADVIILDKSVDRLRSLNNKYQGRVKCAFSATEAIGELTGICDLVIGSVLVPGTTAPKLVNRELIGNMKKGSVIVDVAIDQGGCFETSKPTTHDDPVFVVDDVVHYCVANMPGIVPRTSTLALNNVILPYVALIANKGLKAAFMENTDLLNGLNVYRGKVTYQAVAESVGADFISPAEAIRH